MIKHLSRWATPLTIGSFIISAVTGILIFFHINIGLVKPSHEWLSWLMVIGVAAHITVNWKVFLRYFSTAKKLSLSLIIGCCALTILSIIPLGANTQGGPPMMKAANIMNSAPLTQVASLMGQDVNLLTSKLQNKQYKVSNINASLNQIAKDNDTQAMQLLNIILEK